MNDFREAMLALPCVGEAAEGKLDYWLVRSTGRYDEDCRQGRIIAADVIAAAADHRAPILIGSVLRAIGALPIQGGIETGFLAEVGERLVAAVQVTPAAQVFPPLRLAS